MVPYRIGCKQGKQPKRGCDRRRIFPSGGLTLPQNYLPECGSESGSIGMAGVMLPRERCDYSAIVDRPPLKLPGGARLVLWTIVNLEVWEIERAMARQVLPAPTGVPLLPDVPNWSWHEYGMRVGFWRFKAALDRFGVTPTVSINAGVCDNYPRV